MKLIMTVEGNRILEAFRLKPNRKATIRKKNELLKLRLGGNSNEFSPDDMYILPQGYLALYKYGFENEEVNLLVLSNWRINLETEAVPNLSREKLENVFDHVPRVDSVPKTIKKLLNYEKIDYEN